MKSVAASLMGSSPLTRGKRGLVGGHAGGGGLIPAHAGKTRCRRWCRSCRWAHPRSRGENTGEIEDAVREAGSSPLTRGKLMFSSWSWTTGGLIPAHAGKTRLRWGGSGGGRAHPRSRGENFNRVRATHYTLGSSPLTRGKPQRRRAPCRTRGLIPAHAGKTSSRMGRSLATTAHPRSRGENPLMFVTIIASAGSSPLTRGKPPAASHVVRRRGLIPAHAGKTASTVLSWTRTPAHPRSRGENTFGARIAATAAGSSPLTRGKHRG